MLLVMGIASITTTLPAYQVWSSPCRTPRSILDTPEQWSVMAPRLQGFNLNFAPGMFQPRGTEWQQILSKFTTARSETYAPWNHPDFPITKALATDWIQKVLDRGIQFGYTDIKYAFLTDTQTKWTDTEIQIFRDALVDMGRADIGIAFNARSGSAGNQVTLSLPIVTCGINEAQPEYWAINKGGRRDLLVWFTSTAATKNKPFIFHTTVHHNWNDGIGNFGNNDGFEAVRLMLRSISADILGSTDWIKTDKAIIQAMTYDDYPAVWPYLPETNNSGGRYGTSMTGLLLSLIEQRDRFEGRGAGGLISVAGCNSFIRNSISMEAEEATTLAGGTSISTISNGYSSMGYVDMGGNGSSVEWGNVSASPTNRSSIVITYANGTAVSRRCNVTVNGVSYGNFNFVSTGSWSTWGTQTIAVTNLSNTGLNTVKITANTSSGGPNVDFLTVK